MISFCVRFWGFCCGYEIKAVFGLVWSLIRFFEFAACFYMGLLPTVSCRNHTEKVLNFIHLYEKEEMELIINTIVGTAYNSVMVPIIASLLLLI